MRPIDILLNKLNIKANKLSEEAIYTILSICIASIFIFVSFFSYSIWLFIFSYLIIGYLIFKKPVIGIYLAIFVTMIFERYFTLMPIQFQDYVIKLYPLDIVLIITAISALLKYPAGKFKFKIKQIELPFMVFAGFVFLSFIVSSIFLNADWQVAFSTFKNYCLYAIFFYLVINLVKTKEQFNRLIHTILYAGIGILFFVFWGIAAGRGLWSEYVPLSTFGSRLLAGTHAWYVFILIIGIFCYLLWRKKNYKQEYMLFFLMVLFLFGLAGSLIRHLWLALIFVFIIMLLILGRKKRIKLVKIFTVILLVIFVTSLSLVWYYSFQSTSMMSGKDFITAFEHRIESLFTSSFSDQSSTWRLAAWQEAFSSSAKVFFLGIGLGQTITFEFDDFFYTIEARELHNDFVAIILQLGVVGIGLFIWLLFSIFKFAISNYKKIDNEYKPYYLACSLLIVAFLFSANFGVYFDINLLIIFLWLFISMLYIMTNLSKAKSINQ